MTEEDFGDGDEGPDAVLAQEGEVSKVDAGLRSELERRAMRVVDAAEPFPVVVDNPLPSEGGWDESWEDALQHGTD